MSKKRWVYGFLSLSLSMVLGVGVLNYIVDPYSMTAFNVLGIPVKLVSDDRSEKISRIDRDFDFDNVLLGSSRVYLINPLMLSKYVGGNSYNLGVGTAQIEDHLGFLLHLEKENKFPKFVLMGLDFYAFNKNLETNKYFTRNKDLNFISNEVISGEFIGDFLSFDMFQASMKTLKTFIGMNKRESRFDENGASVGASLEFNYFPKSSDVVDIYAVARENHDSDFIKSPPYESVSDERLGYLERVVDLCKRHHSNLVVFITPLYAQLMDDIHNDVSLSVRLDEFKNHVASITDYYDFLTYNEVTKSSIYFQDPSHVKHTTGNLILARLFNDRSINVPEGFGVFRIKNKEVVELSDE